MPPISNAQFDTLTRAACGMSVSLAWRGHGSAIFLELGQLQVQPDRKHPRGEFSIMIEWSWRVESARSILFGSWSSERKISSGVDRLEGLTVERLQVQGRLPELVVALSSKRTLHSFMSAEGQPQWTVFLPDQSWIYVERGRLVHHEA